MLAEPPTNTAGDVSKRNEDINNGIWADPEFDGLSNDAALLYLWSFTNPYCGMSGIYKIAKRKIAEGRLEGNQLDAALKELADARLAFYEDGVFWVRARAKRLRTKGENMQRSIETDLESLPTDHPLLIAFCEEYEHSWISGVVEGFGKGSGRVQESGSTEPKPGTLSEPSEGFQGKGRGRGKGFGDVEKVWEHYVATMGKRGRGAELRDDERKIIRDALAAGDVDELKTCVSACERSDYHMKRGDFCNRRGGKYNSIGKIFKPRPRHGETQRSRIEWWLEAAGRMEAESDSGWAGFIDEEDAA